VNGKKIGVIVIAAFVVLFALNSPKSAAGIAQDGKKIATSVFNQVSNAIKTFTDHKND